ncbi:6-phosphogluconolactonase [Deltaproteobacteria bacterium]|nr:6-phosphogluconolactonase [Deltaproteobacteria bacterium]
MNQKPQIIIRDNLSDLSHTGAHIFTSSAIEAVTNKGHFVTAISGGISPGYMHRLLAEDSYLSKIPWSKTHIFWVDERCVPENDTASNYGEARRDFLDIVPIPSDQIHNMPVEVSPEEGAQSYQQELIKFFRLKRGELPVFDLIFMGIGPDGHTASLFPGNRALEENKRLILSVKGGDPRVHRLTMTFPVLNNARKTAFLVSGNSKSEILWKVLKQRQKGLPAQMIKPVKGELIWLIDREAASLLD